MENYFELINDFEELVKQNRSLVDVIGDCPNIERLIAPETIFWKKVAEKGGYECQENVFPGSAGSYHHITPE